MQEADFAVPAFTITKERAEVVDYMAPIWDEKTSLLARVPQPDKLLTYLKPFQV